MRQTGRQTSHLWAIVVSNVLHELYRWNDEPQGSLVITVKADQYVVINVEGYDEKEYCWTSSSVYLMEVNVPFLYTTAVVE